MPDNLARLLLDGWRWFDDRLREELAHSLDVEITPAQSLLFAALPAEGARQADLARELGVTRQAVNELVRGLVKQGLVELVDDPSSGRAKLVRPTPAGLHSIEVALRTFADLEARLQDRIGPRRVTNLRGALEADWGD